MPPFSLHNGPSRSGPAPGSSAFSSFARLAAALTLVTAATFAPATLEAQAPTDSATPNAYSEDASAAIAAASAAYPTKRVGGFADVEFGGMGDPDGMRFKLGKLVLHASAELSPYWSFFAELTVGTGGVGSAKAERILIRYDYSEYLTFTAGRYHQPILYWNRTFHHGTWLQTTASRPEIIAFGGKLLPVHSIGVAIEGAVPGMSALGMRYHLAATGGDADHSHGATEAKEVHERLEIAYTGVLTARPEAIDGLQIGVAGYMDGGHIHAGQPGSELTVSGHVVLDREEPELIAEALHVRHTRGNQTFVSNAAYAQVAWRIRQLEGRFKPYYRFEWSRLAANDIGLIGLKSHDIHTVGLRTDLYTMVALKTEYRNNQPVGGNQSHGGFVQLGVAW